MPNHPSINERKYQQLKDASNRALKAIGTTSLENLLAILGFTTTNVLSLIPQAERHDAALAWCNRLLETVHAMDTDNSQTRH